MQSGATVTSLPLSHTLFHSLTLTLSHSHTLTLFLSRLLCLLLSWQRTPTDSGRDCADSLHCYLRILKYTR